MEISDYIAEQADFLVNTRRHLHQIPEVAFEEVETSAYLYKALEEMHPDMLEHMAGTGIKAVFFGRDQNLSIAIRSDMDALPIQEQTGLSFASQHPGVMHACGHDGHMAMALTTAKIISQERDKQSHSYTFIFQPAEETTGGALKMIQEGVLDAPKVKRIYGLHLWPYLEEGFIGLRPGPLMAAMTDFKVHIAGKSAHGAKPHEGKDAIVAAAQFVTAAQSIVSRSIDPFDTAVMTIGKLNAGQASNVIADTADMEGTVRSFREDVDATVRTRLRDLCHGVDKMYGLRCDYTESMTYPAVDNPEDLFREAVSILPRGTWREPNPVMISEDFAYYQKEVPGFFAFVGTASPGYRHSLHSSSFSYDEIVLQKGVEFYLRVTGFRP